MRISESVVVRYQDGEAFILDMASGRYSELNRSGAVAWTAVERGEHPVAALARAYPDQPIERVAADWTLLREILLAEGLLQVVDDPGAEPDPV